MVRDEQLAEALSGEDDDRRKPERRMADWSVEVELLSQILDRLGEVVQVSAAGRGARNHRVEPAPRPTTAIRKYKDRQRQERHLALVAQVLPHKAGDADTPDLPGPAQ